MAQAQFDVIPLVSYEELLPYKNRISKIIQDAFGLDQTLEHTLDLINFGDGGAVMMTGWSGGELATINAFIRQDFLYESTVVAAYQSGFSATGNAFRGQGLWPKLLLESEQVLSSMGGQWIFGFPNPLSQPLFERKLEYQTARMMKSFFPPSAARFFFAAQNDTLAVVPDLSATIRWKLRAKGDTFFTFSTGDALGFGNLKRWHGVPYLEIGAINSGSTPVSVFIKEMCKGAGVMVASLESNEGSRQISSIPFKKYSRPLITKSLRAAVLPSNFEFPIGLADTF